MSRDYKPKTKKKTGGFSTFLSGLLFGFLFGVITAVAFTIYLKGDTSPFEQNTPKPATIEPKAKTQPTAKQADSKKPEDDFDFYTILPETESTVSVKEIDNEDVKTKTDSYYLQIASFKAIGDAEKLKAKLALQGFEASVQTANIPEKGTWHRVRIGPLNHIDSINKTRESLANNNFNSDLIKVTK